MSEQPTSFLSPFGKQAAQFTWLICDALIFMVLLSLFLFYKDLADDNMRTMIRVYFLYSIGFFLLSAAHLLAYHRHDDAEEVKVAANPNYRYKQFPAWKSYGLFFLKVLWTITFIFTCIPYALPRAA